MTDSPKIKAKHAAVVEAYLANGFKRDQAVIAAGYSERRARQTASEIFKREDVKAYLAERWNDLKMSADEALARLVGHATGSVAEFIGLTPEELKAHPQAALIKKIKFTTIIPEPLPPKIVDGVVVEQEQPKPYQLVESVELYSAQVALELIGKHHKLFTDKHELSGEDGKPIPVFITGMDMNEL